MATDQVRRDRVVTARLGKRGPEEQEFDRAFWRQVGHEGRFAAAWQMVAEAAVFKGADGSQPRLKKSVETLRRRGWSGL